MKTIILASGENSRLFPFSRIPNPLLRLGYSSLLAHYLDWLKKIALSNVNIVVDEANESIQKQFGNGSDYNCHINYCSQPHDKPGIGNALSLAKENINVGDYFLLIYGDTIFDENVFLAALETFSATKEAVAVITHSKTPKIHGNIYLDHEMCINKLVEKPEEGQWGNYVLGGVFILPYSFFQILEDNNSSMEAALQKFLHTNKLKASLWEEEWIDIVYPWDILAANRIVMDKWEGIHIHSTADIAQDVHINGPVYIDEGAEIKGGTIINGPVYIGKNSIIGNNALIRNYTSLGEGAKVGYGVEVKNCVLFNNVVIGRLSFLGDSVIGENVDIGSGVMTINSLNSMGNIPVEVNGKEIDSERKKVGTFVGNESVIGANNIIKPGTIIPPDSDIPAHYTYPAS